MLLDIFKSDAFALTKLVAAVNRMPYQPTKLGDMKLFAEGGINTTSVAIEMQNGVLTLVPSASRGAPGPAKNLERRTVRDFRTVHLPQRIAVMADEVQGLRAYGTESEEEVAMRYLEKKMVIPRRDLDITHEWQRMGAVKGNVLDADGTTVIYNYFTEFGVTQQALNFALSVGGTKVLQFIVSIKRAMEDKLGGVANSGAVALCSAEFMDAFTGHAAVQASYQYQMSNKLREDYRDGFDFGGIWWMEYRGQVGATRFIAANEAYVIPTGVPELFKTFFAPAPYMDTVNTEGVPFYAARESMDFNTGVQVQLQSNPLHMCTRPESIIKLTAT